MDLIRDLIVFLVTGVVITGMVNSCSQRQEARASTRQEFRMASLDYAATAFALNEEPVTLDVAPRNPNVLASLGAKLNAVCESVKEEFPAQKGDLTSLQQLMQKMESELSAERAGATTQHVENFRANLYPLFIELRSKILNGIAR